MATTASLIGVIFCFVFVPRTKNKSLYELEMLFSKEKHLDILSHPGVILGRPGGILDRSLTI